MAARKMITSIIPNPTILKSSNLQIKEMRIIGYIEHPVMKITVFKMDNRLSVKFETGMHEQTYKFRVEDAVQNLEDVRRIVDETFQEAVLQVFKTMRMNSMRTLSRNLPRAAEDEFDSII